MSRVIVLELIWAGAVAHSRDAHLSDDKTVAKMGHPDWWKGYEYLWEVGQ